MRLHLVDGSADNLKFVALAAEMLGLKKYHLLLSYHYYQKTNLAVLKAGLGNCEIMLDSGAFSAATQGTVIAMDAYAKYIQTYGNAIKTYVNLDVIGDAKASAVNQAILENEYGLSPLPVFHVGSDFKELEALMQKYDYVALGGLVPHSGKRKTLMPYFVRCFQMAQVHGTRLHGLGVTSVGILRSFPWYSVDSSSWSASARYGHVKIFDFRTHQVVSVKLKDAAGVLGFARFIRACGIDPNDILNAYHHGQVRLVAAAAWLCFMLWLTALWKQDLEAYVDGVTNRAELDRYVRQIGLK